MSSKIVQVRPDVSDPDFPSFNLENEFLEYVNSMPDSCSMFKFVTPSRELVNLCKSKGYNPNLICLSNSDVFWHEKDWFNKSTQKEVNLASYNIIKRKR